MTLILCVSRIWDSHGMTPSEVDSARTSSHPSLCPSSNTSPGYFETCRSHPEYTTKCVKSLKPKSTQVSTNVRTCPIDRDGLQSLRKGESRFASSIVSNHSTQSPYNIPVFHHLQINSPSTSLAARVAVSSIST